MSFRAGQFLRRLSIAEGYHAYPAFVQEYTCNQDLFLKLLLPRKKEKTCDRLPALAPQTPVPCLARILKAICRLIRASC